MRFLALNVRSVGSQLWLLAILGLTIAGHIPATADVTTSIIFANDYSSVQQAINSSNCPAAGCVIYATASTVNTNLGSLDPGSKVITLYLGPTTYTVTQITLRTGFKIIGNGTVLQAATANSALFVEPPGPIQHVELDGLVVCGYTTVASCGNNAQPQNCTTSQVGLYLQAQSNGGIWYSRFSNLVFQCFGGDAIYIHNGIFSNNTNPEGINQFLTFENVVAFRTQSGSYSLHIDGQGGQYTFINCEFDGTIGASTRLGGANIYIAGNSSGVPPYSVDFYGLTSQAANLAVQLNGVWGAHFYAPHFEGVNQGFYLTNSSSGVTVDSGVFITGAFVDQSGDGKGFGIYLDNTSSATFTNNFIFSADQIWVNSGTLWAWNNSAPSSAKTVGPAFQAKPPSQPAPTCDAANGGMVNYGAGGSGVKDWVAVCAKDASNTWAWRTIF